MIGIGIIKRLKNGSKRGSALILTLAILYLMLMIGLFFAFDARMSEKTSNNYRYSVQARLLHEAGFSRALGTIKSFSTLDIMHQQFLNPAYFSEPGSGQLPLPGSGPFITGDGYLSRRYFFPSSDVDGSGIDTGLDNAFSVSFRDQADSVLWSFLSRDDLRNVVRSGGTWDSMLVANTVLGNHAYLIMDETGKMTVEQLASISRLTPSIGEIEILPSEERSTDTMYSFFQLVRSMLDVYHDSDLIHSVVFPGMLKTAEEYWIDRDGDSICDVGEVYDRHQVMNIGDRKILDSDKLYALLLAGDPDETDTEYFNWDSCLWMKGVELPIEPRLTKDMAARRYAAQLTANIWDYTDDDDSQKMSPTVLGVGLNGRLDTDLSFPLYNFPPDMESVVYGMENSLSLVGVSIRFILLDTSSTEKVDPVLGDTYDWCIGKVRAEATLQLHNPYSLPLKDISAEMGCTLEYYEYTARNDSRVVTPPGEFTFSVDMGADTEVVSAVQTVPCLVMQEISGIILGERPELSIKEVVLDKLVIYREGISTQVYPKHLTPGGADFAHKWTYDTQVEYAYEANLRARSDGRDIAYPMLSPEIQFEGHSVAYETDSFSDPAFAWESLVQGFSRPNMDSEFLYDSDMFNAYFSYDASDIGAEVRNSAIETLQEFGMIRSPHTPFLSLRFIGTVTGESHDGYLLDVFASDTMDKFTVNLNTGSDAVCRVLLKHAGFSGSFNDEVKAWFEMNGADPDEDGYPRLYRGDLLTVLSGSGDEQSAINLAQILDTRQNYYTVITAGRAVQDLGGGLHPEYEGHTRYVETSARTSGIAKAMYRTISGVYRDAWTGDIKVLRQTVLEE